MADYLPTREPELVVWTRNMSVLLNKQSATFGVTADQATAYTTLQAAFAGLVQLANDNSTRTPSVVTSKTDAKTALVAETRRLVRIVQAYPGITDTLRRDLGITVPDVRPTPSGPPTTEPVLDVVSVSGRTVKVRIRDSEQPDRRGRPAGYLGVMLYSAVGPTPPEDLAGWRSEGLTARTTISVVLPLGTPAGAQIWLTACWVGKRMLTGTACEPVTTRIPGSLGLAA